MSKTLKKRSYMGLQRSHKYAAAFLGMGYLTGLSTRESQLMMATAWLPSQPKHLLLNTIYRSPYGVQCSTGFSPEGSALELILQVVRSAKEHIDVAAYGFTSLPIAQALVDAQARGVQVRLVIDDQTWRASKQCAAVRRLCAAGVMVRSNADYAIHHDKFMIIDKKTIQTGSFNYSKNAETKNSENVMVVWEHPDLGEQYALHWQRRWDRGQPVVFSFKPKASPSVGGHGNSASFAK